jgi:asparagine synthase (glutamine-hydrolysing)
MSVQFGKCNFDGETVTPEDLDQVRSVLAPYGPDGEGYVCKDNFAVLYRAFHATKESRREVQPHVMRVGAVLVWDGRLDNREELIRGLERKVSADSADVEIVAAAYELWGTGSFAKLMGDWAVSIWDMRNQSLTLAKDFVGTRHLYYSVEKEQVTWCTILDPLVSMADRSFELDEQYLAGWLGFFPAPHLTPFVGVHSVPAAAFVQVTRHAQKMSRYWHPDRDRQICYRKDAEYEEHFRTVFAESVKRRLRCDTPIIAELSGGIDSSSIVCTADLIMQRKQAADTSLSTISFFDESEPNWNEAAYFKRVEQKLGRTGCHIDTSMQPMLNLEIEPNHFAPTPAFFASTEESDKALAACLKSNNVRVILSGIGGDEVMGGVPTPTPQLQDLLVSLHFQKLFHHLAAWALDKRVPWFHLLWEAISGFFPQGFAGVPKHRQPLPWLTSEFSRRNREALQGYQKRVNLFGARPSLQENISTLEAIRRRMSCTGPALDPTYERRYPYLDRDLLEFVFCIPRDQLVRPGQRRSLMRRALAEIVPSEILNRRRKGFVARRLREAVNIENRQLFELTQNMRIASFGIVDQASFGACLGKARDGHEFPGVRVARTICLELWLRSLIGLGIVRDRYAMTCSIAGPARDISAEQI